MCQTILRVGYWCEQSKEPGCHLRTINFIYTKDREVYIKNTKAFQDTLYVRIVPETGSVTIKNGVEKDSSKINSNLKKKR